ncbi:cysteine-rich repeat secretory protein 55-like [Wolffia australiana]
MFARLTTLLPALFLLLLSCPRSNAADPLENYCSYTRKATAAAKKNIELVLVSIETNAPTRGLAIAEYGAGDKERANGLAQCRRDVRLAECKTCLKEASARLSSRCRGKAEGWVWFEKCFMRYDTNFFVGTVDTSYGAYNNSDEFVTDDAAERQRFDTVLGSLIDKVRIQATSESRFGLGKAISKFSRNVTVYALAQCTRDLSGEACSECITYAFRYFPDVCAYKKRCRALYPSCYVGYDTKPFFDL